jgi:hypothetical protein
MNELVKYNIMNELVKHNEITRLEIMMELKTNKVYK